MEKQIANKIIILLIAVGLCGGLPVFAACGTIDSTSRYAWTENAGWLDFGTSQGNVQVTDSALTGYAWGENIGWISLNCSNTSSCATVDYKVSNDGNGTLSGYAWGENAGWINFAPTGGGVTINSGGEFLGYAWGENIGWIVFNCATTGSCATVDYKVKTTWRPSSGAVSTSGSSSSGQYSLPVARAKMLPWALPQSGPQTTALTGGQRQLILAQINQIILKIAELKKQLAILLGH